MSDLPYGLEEGDDPNDEARSLRNQLRLLEEQQRRLARAMEKRPDDIGLWVVQTKLSTSLTAVSRSLLAVNKSNQDKVDNLTDDEKLELSLATIKGLSFERQMEAAKHLNISVAATGREARKNATGTHAGRFAPGPDARRVHDVNHVPKPKAE